MREGHRSGRLSGATVLGLGLIIGLGILGWLLGNAALSVKSLERSVTVKGLAEREVNANIVIWPIQFNAASNNLTELYKVLDDQRTEIEAFLRSEGITAEEISSASPSITDKSAQQYGGGSRAEFRYTGSQIVTVYSREVAKTRAVMGKLPDLGKQGIVFSGNDYSAQTQYLFTELNTIKPQMVEEATRNAREVAQKFAADSDSKLGKIRRASQGQFSITNRDSSNPQIKQVRVVSTIEYYLSD